MPGVEIISRPRNHYVEDVLSRTQVCSWINEVGQGRTDFSTITSRRRELNEDVAALIAGKLDADSHLSLCAKIGELLWHCTTHSLPVLD
jgi:hypothetical protein